MNQYEGMFLFDPTFGGTFENCEKEIKRLIDRAGGEIILCRKWDERRLAYRIEGRKRGVYALTYFKAPPDKIRGLERDVKLSEDVLRVLVLSAKDVTPEAMERAFLTAREERPRYERNDYKSRRDESKPRERQRDGAATSERPSKDDAKAVSATEATKVSPASESGTKDASESTSSASD